MNKLLNKFKDAPTRFVAWILAVPEPAVKGYTPEVPASTAAATGQGEKTPPWVPKPPPRNPNAPAGHEWHAMPGNRIELGSTGFAIELREIKNPLMQGMGFQAFTPEGQPAWCSLTDLPGLKKLCEELAKHRAEFHQ